MALVLAGKARSQFGGQAIAINVLARIDEVKRFIARVFTG